MLERNALDQVGWKEGARFHSCSCHHVCASARFSPELGSLSFAMRTVELVTDSGTAGRRQPKNLHFYQLPREVPLLPAATVSFEVLGSLD